jgi:hypothetical protein
MIGVVPGIHQVMHHQSMIQSDRKQDKLVCGDPILDSRLSLKVLKDARQFLVYFAEQSAKFAFELPVPRGALFGSNPGSCGQESRICLWGYTPINGFTILVDP